MQIEQMQTALASASRNDAGTPQSQPCVIVPDHVLIRRIGAGAYGEVWLARNVLGGYRAVKAVFRASFKTEVPYEREFSGLQRFEPISRSNEGFVDILQVGRNDAAGYFYSVMELADPIGPVQSSKSEVLSHPSALARTLDAQNYIPKTLRSEIQLRGRLPVAECVELGMSVSVAVANLHRHGLLHRDIKPSNIIFVGGIPKLADIGLVTDFRDARSFVGTEGFTPPEGPNTPQADIYSLGKVLYEISMGKDRKDFPDPATVFGEGAESEALEELNAVILKACASTPPERYQTAEELNADLALLNSGKSVKRKQLVERRLDWSKKAAGIAAALAVLATVAFLFQRTQTREAQRNHYIASMNLAQRDWDSSGKERLAQLLTETEGYPEKGFEWYYWQRQLHLDLKTLRGHSDAVNAVAFSPDNRRLLSGSADHTARIWDAANGLEILVLKGHAGPVVSVAYSADGTWIVTGSLDGSARIWNVSDGRAVRVLRHMGSVFAIATSPDGKRIVTVSRISGQPDLIVAEWDSGSGEKRRVLGERTGGHGLSAAAYSADGRRIAAITDSKQVTVWDAASGQELAVGSSTDELYSVAFSPDGMRLVTGSSGRSMVWDATSGAVLMSLRSEGQRGVSTAAFSPDGSTVASAGGDQKVIVWNSTTGEELFRLLGHRAAVTSLAFSPNGGHVATGSADATVKIWDARALPTPRTFSKQARETQALAISPDGNRIATATWGKTVHLWEVATGRELIVLAGIVDEVTDLAFSPDGRRLATGNGWYGREGRDHARIWDVSTGRELPSLGGSGFVAFAPDGRSIATSSGNAAVIIWDAGTGDELLRLIGHADWVQSGVFSPDGKRIATACGDSSANLVGRPTVKIWDTATGRELLTINRGKPNGTYVSRLAFSPDGTRIALAGQDRKPRIWDVSTGRELFALRGHLDGVLFIDFSPDGQRIVTASFDRTAKVWDALTGRELLTLEGHTRAVTAAAFLPDGRRIATTGLDGLIKIWETASPEQVLAWRKDKQDEGRAASLTPD